MPKSRTEFWMAKFAANVARDAAAERKLIDAGWRVITIWECETRTQDTLALRLLSVCDASEALRDHQATVSLSTITGEDCES